MHYSGMPKQYSAGKKKRPALPKMSRAGLFALRSRRSTRWFGNLGYCLREPIRLRFQRQICLRNNTDDAVIPIHDRHPPYLMLLHQAFTLLDVLSVATGEGVLTDVVLNGSCLGIESTSDNTAAQITISDDSQQSFRLLVAHHRNEADVLLTHHPCDCLRVV